MAFYYDCHQNISKIQLLGWYNCWSSVLIFSETSSFRFGQRLARRLYNGGAWCKHASEKHQQGRRIALEEVQSAADAVSRAHGRLVGTVPRAPDHAPGGWQS